ncbi:hypothetical protein F5Y12DRAFT_534711 [Xylaria sp. FL1777]|nr:hypothetical protein F5Y12DRAFT_534711 [Xylaria sp. FL1777]
MCGCQRTTYLCLCRHKERIIDRCHVYQLRQEGSCWAWFFPNCRTTVRRYQPKRVCRACEEYFRQKYGEEQYKIFIELFLEYKESKGWSKTAIDPRSVPREVLLKRQSCPPNLGTEGRARSRGQPFQIHQPMISNTTPAITNDNHRYPGPAVSMRRKPVPQVMNPPPSALASSDSIKHADSQYVHTTDNPLPADPNLFVVGDDEQDDDGAVVVGKQRESTPSPIPKYKNTNLPPGVVIPELAHLAEGRRVYKLRYRRSFPEIQQPIPSSRRIQKKPLRRADSGSDISVVKKLTKMARNIDIPNVEYIEFEGKFVPRVITPPKGRRRSRTPTPSPPPTDGPAVPDHRSYSYNGAEAIDITIAANAVPDSLIPGKGIAEEADRQDSGLMRSPSTYFVVTHPDASSPTGASARVRHSPSHKNVVIPPPQRLDGILVPSSSTAYGGSFFKERGLPSKTYVRQEIQSATFAPYSPMLVSVNVPERRYSCAVQSCYCDNERDNDKCPSCRERDAISQQHHTTWI